MDRTAPVGGRQRVALPADADLVAVQTDALAPARHQFGFRRQIGVLRRNSRKGGFELCRQIRRSPTLSKTPVLFLTARSDEVDRVLGLEIGGDDYMTKPFSPRELVARVKAHLRREEMDVEGGSLKAIQQAFASSGYDMRALVVALTKTRAFTHRNPIAAVGN